MNESLVLYDTTSGEVKPYPRSDSLPVSQLKEDFVVLKVVKHLPAGDEMAKLVKKVDLSKLEWVWTWDPVFFD